MKIRLKNHRLFSAGLSGGILLFAQAVSADATYDSSAAIDYTITSISNSNTATPNDISSLSVSGSFQQLTDANDFYAATTGDGSYTANNPNLSSEPVTTSFDNTYSVSGDTPLYGTVNTLHTGVYSLNFSNNSSRDTYTIDVTLSYVLTAAAGGLFANSSIQLDYWDTLNNIADNQDYVGAGTYLGYTTDTETEPGSYNLVLSLAPGTSDSFITQAAISSSLDSTANAAPVPLPLAGWSFLSGLLGILSIRKRKQRQI